MNFRYHARDVKRAARDGTIEALDEQGAVKKLQEQGLVVISIEMAEIRKPEIVKEENLGGQILSNVAETILGGRKGHPRNKIFIVLICILVCFVIFCGIFVIQPIGAIPEGVTIVYWRFGLNLPFIASADGMLDKTRAGVSLLGRGIMLGGIANIIKERKLFRLLYFELIYLCSTGGKKYE